MLAQTQVDRVVPRFEAFVARFPDFSALARASVADVVREWKGLGYNSRAVRLRSLAQALVESHDGVLPRETQELRALPGIGAYTAAAIRAFAYNFDDAPLDTNIRRIVHRLCFGVEYPGPAPLREVEDAARNLAPRGRAHDWNSAMMDLGAALCTARAPKCPICPLRADCIAAPIDGARLELLRAEAVARRSPQNAIPFAMTTRFARGRIVDRLRDLPPGQHISLLDLHRDVWPAMPTRTIEDVQDLVVALARDGIVTHDGNQIALRE